MTKTMTFYDNSRPEGGQILVTVYEDGTASLAWRQDIGDTWGIPSWAVVREW